MGEQKPVDIDALMAEVRERIRIKREKGLYGPDVEALMRVPLPGGRRIFSDDLQDPLASLAEALDEEVEYDPRSRKPIVGPVITYARKVVISLVRWWMGAILERQERINRLLAAAYDYEGQMAPRFGARLERLEREWKEWREREVAANLHSVSFPVSSSKYFGHAAARWRPARPSFSSPRTRGPLRSARTRSGTIRSTCGRSHRISSSSTWRWRASPTSSSVRSSRRRNASPRT